MNAKKPKQDLIAS